MRLLLLAAAILFLLGCDEARVSNLEQRVNQLEEKVRKVESEQGKKNTTDSSSRQELETCVTNANIVYENDLQANGTKNAKGYTVPVYVMEQAERKKREAVDECKLLYSK